MEHLWMEAKRGQLSQVSQSLLVDGSEEWQINNDCGAMPLPSDG
jgi:hypothetical protein